VVAVSIGWLFYSYLVRCILVVFGSAGYTFFTICSRLLRPCRLPAVRQGSSCRVYTGKDRLRHLYIKATSVKHTRHVPHHTFRTSRWGIHPTRHRICMCGTTRSDLTPCRFQRTTTPLRHVPKYHNIRSDVSLRTSTLATASLGQTVRI
jgi:hypothetical protein